MKNDMVNRNFKNRSGVLLLFSFKEMKQSIEVLSRLPLLLSRKGKKSDFCYKTNVISMKATAFVGGIV